MFVDNKTPGRVKVYEQKNAIQHNALLGNYYISNAKFTEMKSFIVRSNDFIVSCAGTIGEVYKLPINAETGIINQALMKATLFLEDISDFFELILFDAIHRLSEKSKGTAIKNIVPFEILKPAIVLLPPLNEQTKILKRLSFVTELID